MEHTAHLEPFNLVMDFVLIGLSIWMAIVARKMSMGGAVGKTVSLVVLGAIVLGIAHLVETVLALVFDIPTALNESIHRCIILVGFALLTIGMRSLSQTMQNLKPTSKPKKQ